MRSPALTDLLRTLPEASVELVRRVLACADTRRQRVYLVGGPVRDWLMGRRLRDVDLTVELHKGEDATELAHRVSAGKLRVRVHERFGTVTLQGTGAALDLATVRREQYARDGALPTVEEGTLEEDLRRRDFSVNALAIPLSAAARARRVGIVDVTGGLEDLEARSLRILHARSFHDDPTRALRAARLAPRLGFTLSRHSRAALRAALRDGDFGAVSGDRLRREWVKLFGDAAGQGLDPARSLRLLHDWHVLGALEPGLELDGRAVTPLRRLGRALVEPPWPAGQRRVWVAGMAAWLAPLRAPLRRRVLARLAISGDQATRISEFPRRRDAWLRALERARGRGAVDLLLSGCDEESLLALHAWAPPAARRRIARWAVEDRGRRVPVTGDDLMAMGLTGPVLGRVLERLRVAWLDGSVRTREEALVLAHEISRRSRSKS